MNITLKNLAGDLTYITYIETDDSSIRSLRERVAVMKLETCSHIHDENNNQRWNFNGGCPDCKLRPTNVIMLRRKGEKYERLGNSHRLHDGDEIAYYFRERPDGALGKGIGSKKNAYSYLYDIPEVNTENKDYQWRYEKMNRFFFSIQNGRFRSEAFHDFPFSIEGEFDTIEDLFRSVNQSGRWKYKFSDENIAEAVHLWDVNGE
jgi:hypothetical protein